MTWEKIIEDGLYFPDSRTHDCQGYQLYDLWYKYLKFTLLNNIVYVSTPCLIEIINAIGPIYSSTYALTLLLPKEALSQINFKSRASHPEAYDMCLVSLVCNYLELHNRNDLDTVLWFMNKTEIGYEPVHFMMCVIAECMKHGDVFKGATLTMTKELYDKVYDWYNPILDDYKELELDIKILPIDK